MQETVCIYMYVASQLPGRGLTDVNDPCTTMLIKKNDDDDMLKENYSWETEKFNADGRMHARMPAQVPSFKLPWSLWLR